MRLAATGATVKLRRTDNEIILMLLFSLNSVERLRCLESGVLCMMVEERIMRVADQIIMWRQLQYPGTQALVTAEQDCCREHKTIPITGS